LIKGQFKSQPEIISAYLTVQKYFVPAMWLEISRIPPTLPRLSSFGYAPSGVAGGARIGHEDQRVARDLPAVRQPRRGARRGHDRRHRDADHATALHLRAQCHEMITLTELKYATCVDPSIRVMMNARQVPAQARSVSHTYE
jgi:hypothetical protein